MGIMMQAREFKKGKRNLITDVGNVRVGHKTIKDKEHQTGVTIVDPGSDCMFRNKYRAAAHVINGFGKTSGLVQIDELGTLESYIGLTNTLSVGTVQQAIVKQMLKEDESIGLENGTVNVVVGECNDGYLNAIRDCIVCEQDVEEAFANLSKSFEEGSVGAGRGMQCFQRKGGIGSSSRVLTIDQKEYTIGTLVLSNFGLAKDFTLANLTAKKQEVEKGSIIMIIACDLPLDARQLKRVCKRMHVPLARLGSFMGNGSGDIAIAFSTAEVVPHEANKAVMSQEVLHESYMDQVFRCAIECCEESILSSLWHSETCEGRDGHVVTSIKEDWDMCKK